MGMLANDLYWKCQIETRILLHAHQEYKMVESLWERFVKHIGEEAGYDDI